MVESGSGTVGLVGYHGKGLMTVGLDMGWSLDMELEVVWGLGET